MKRIEVEGKVIGLAFNGDLYVDDSAFKSISMINRNQALFKLMSAGGKPNFQADFSFLHDHKRIIQRLKGGEDVSLELAFNDIELPEGYKDTVETYRAAVSPIIEQLEGLAPQYSFAPVPEDTGKFRFDGDLVIRLKADGKDGSVLINKDDALYLWEKASPYWMQVDTTGNARKCKPREEYRYICGSNFYINYYKERVTTGSKTIYRHQLETVAKHYGFELPTSS
jgi:hypothetical protein